MQPVIHVENLCKNFKIRKSYKGVLRSLWGIFDSKYEEVEALAHLSFTIHRGEKVAFIGPNGAGKSTAIKILTGILHPTSGQVSVLGLTPWQRRRQLGYRIGIVFGQRTQLWYHLPPIDTFDLLAKIYEIPKAAYEERLEQLVDIFELASILYKPVKQLSLGERMRCELVASLLHNPEVLFLDEPTIGLDINAKVQIRSLLNRLAGERGTTLFLTSHDTADIEQICERVLVMDHGTLILDNELQELKKNYICKKRITLFTDGRPFALSLPGVEPIEKTVYRYVCDVDLKQTSVEAVIQHAIGVTCIQDVTIEDPSMEEIIRGVYG